MLPLRFVGFLCPQDPELGSLEHASSVLGCLHLEEILVMDGWDLDGMVFPAFLEADFTAMVWKRARTVKKPL